MILLVCLFDSSLVKSDLWPRWHPGHILFMDESPRLPLVESSGHLPDSSSLNGLGLKRHDRFLILALLLLRRDDLISDSA